MEESGGCSIGAVSYTHLDVYKRQANGWALLTMCEVLDVLPEDYPQRDKILELFRAHVRGLAACQSCLLYTSRCV